jgi:hypothetical protein
VPEVDSPASVNDSGGRVNRVFRVGTANVQPRFELHNALNSASILATNLRYGPQWEQVRTVLTPMMAKFALQVDF